MSQPYSEAMEMRPYVTNTTCATFVREITDDITVFTQFEERGISTKTHNNAESDDKSDDKSIMSPLLSKEEMDAVYSGDDSDLDLISTDMLENICARRKSHLRINQREAC